MITQYDISGLHILKLFSQGDLDHKAWFDLKFQAENLARARGFDRLLALDGLDIVLMEHQKQAVFRVLRQMRGRAVLADEVGLGKTIEAGVILREYWLRGLARRILILVPAPLVEQWQQEMSEKLDLDFAIINTPEDWTRNDLIVASLDMAKHPRHAATVHGLRWDAIAIDEAHRLKNHESANWNFVNLLQKKYMLLLTATPIQNDLGELFNMITLLKPGQLRTFQLFKQEFMHDMRSPRNVQKLKALLGEVMVRSTRRDSAVVFPHRYVETLEVPLEPNERRFYDLLLEALRTAYATQPPDQRQLLVFLVLLRAACSHPATALRTFSGMVRRGTLSGIPKSVLTRLREARHMDKPTKLTVLADHLQHADEKTIVFTEFRTTQKAILAWLKDCRIPAVSYHGALTHDARELAIRDFRSHAHVMVSTDAACEGRNFQFCHRLINYDLPWNPMRLEQRIGRIHRIGQKHDVHVLNIAAQDTLDSYVLYLLDKKIDMFRQVIGDLDTILATLDQPLEQKLTHLFLQTGNPDILRSTLDTFGAGLKEAESFPSVLTPLDQTIPLPALHVSDI